MRNHLSSMIGSLLTIGLLGCGSGQTKSQPITSTAQAHEASTCPMMPSAGTTIVASDTADGIAIAFTTAGDATDLRARTHRMAEMHDRMSAMHHDMHAGMGSGSGMGSGGMQGMGSGMENMQMVPSRATVEDVAGGARIVLVPTDPAQLSALRAHAREHVVMMQKGECPMDAKPDAEEGHEGHHPGA